MPVETKKQCEKRMLRGGFMYSMEGVTIWACIGANRHVLYYTHILYTVQVYCNVNQIK